MLNTLTLNIKNFIRQMAAMAGLADFRFFDEISY